MKENLKIKTKHEIFPMRDLIEHFLSEKKLVVNSNF